VEVLEPFEEKERRVIRSQLARFNGQLPTDPKDLFSLMVNIALECGDEYQRRLTEEEIVSTEHA